MSCGVAAHAACTVTSSAVAFGAYNPASSANVEVLSSVDVRCNPPTNVKVSVGLGNGAGARFSTGRKMTRMAGGGTLTYNLYLDAARTVVLGDGTDGSTVWNTQGHKLTFDIFGRIPGSQPAVQAGSYVDTVIVTVSY
ncbi:MAG: spore coat U domain-containing protein [Polaromonas sp.]